MNLGYEESVPVELKIKVNEAYEGDVLEESSVIKDFYASLETAQRLGADVTIKYDDKKDITIDVELGKFLLMFYKNKKKELNDAASGVKVDFVHALAKAVSSSQFNSFKP